MFSHIMIGSNDLDRSRTFYDALSAATGGRPGTIDPRGRLVYARNGGRLMLTTPINGEPATSGNGTTIGFAIDDPDQAAAWHAAGLANGGTAIEDAPGRRETPFGSLYLAYLRDPDGNKLCALHRVAG
ncbi:VOC family protein [Sphingomonas bacterium]|uniref:VOC family protein n=1 Tax=Sphingomonas bacterium TaxID=1895847 RepID=UPI0015766C71|nr:VOC family protein [Sphingomonas bacterium]